MNPHLTSLSDDSWRSAPMFPHNMLRVWLFVAVGQEVNTLTDTSRNRGWLVPPRLKSCWFLGRDNKWLLVPHDVNGLLVCEGMNVFVNEWTCVGGYVSVCEWLDVCERVKQRGLSGYLSPFTHSSVNMMLLTRLNISPRVSLYNLICFGSTLPL